MKIRISVLVFLFFLLMSPPVDAWAGNSFTIALLEGPEGETMYHRQTIKEINTLLKNRVDVEYVRVEIGPDQEAGANYIISGIMEEDSIDCVIGIGIAQSELLIRLGQYSKPTIAATILDYRLQGLPLNSDGASGVRNLNYIQSPFDIEKDLKTFKTLYDYKHLAVLLPAGETIMFDTLSTYFSKAMETVSPASKISVVKIDPENIEKSVADIPPGSDAVYILPLYLEERPDRTEELIRAINERKLPSFALMGERHVRMGAMASIASEQNLNAMTRRIAINVLEILDGRDAGSLPVIVTAYSDNFVVNVETLRRIECYPEWKALEAARLLNLDKLRQGPEIELKSVILEALERNLDLQMEKADTQLQAGQVDVTRSALLPQLHLSSGVTHVDKHRVETSGTIGARTTWSASAGFSQILFSDDLLTDYAIQKILLESQKYQEKAVLLDTVIIAAQAYIDYLSARSNQAIQNQNLEVTRKNLDIARNKAAVGAVDKSEVNRWESEKARNQIRLNDAYRDLQLAGMAMNQVLGRKINQEFTPVDIEPETAIELMVTDPEVYQLVGNHKQLERFSDFLLREADKNLPELKQVEQSLRLEERRLINRRRALYLPDVTLTGSADKIFAEYDAVNKTPSDLDHPWSVSVVASWPLFAGGVRKKELALSRISLHRIRMEQKDLRIRLHLNVRSGLETAAVSAREIELAESARVSAKKSFEIIQAGYAQGRNSVTDLVDAQNAMLTSELNATLSRYQFVIDFLALERSIGRFHFLDSPEQKKQFISRLREHMEIKPTRKKTHRK